MRTTPSKILLPLAALLLTAALTAPAPAEAQVRGQYESYAAAGGCIGGELCEQNGDRLEIRLDGQPVESVRFRAHDDIGGRSGGRLRVSLGDEVLAPSLEIPREGDFFTFDARGSRARLLTFEVLAEDEVVIEDIEVLYVSGGNDRAGGEWRDYAVPETCIGGDLCSDRSLEIRLEGRDLEAVRFRAHDDVGSRSDGRLRVLVDDHVLSPDLRVAKEGEVYSLDARGLSGRVLRFETVTDDEVMLEDLRVLYAGQGRVTEDRRRGWRRGRGRRGDARTTGEGWDDREGTYGGSDATEGRRICIGGDECGRNGSTYTVHLDRFPVEEIRFRAHDHVGSRNGGKLTVRLGDRVLAEDLDIPKAGETFTLNARGFSGDELTFEVASDDEVVLEDVGVSYRGYRRER
jgi:hypothetical protein